MKSLKKEKQNDMIDVFNSTSRHLDNLLKTDNILFEQLVHRIYPTRLQLNKVNASDTEAAFLDFYLSIHDDTFLQKIYDKQYDFDFDIANFFRSLMVISLGVPLMVYIYISQFIRFARSSSSHFKDFNNRNKFLTAKLLKQGSPQSISQILS